MNYTKIYEKLIEKAQNRVLSGYGEKHHIKPRCLGGTSERSNVVKLSGREHYLAHRLLVLIYPDNIKLMYAYWMMANMSRIGDAPISSREYQRAKKIVAANMRANVGTPEALKKMSESKKGHEHWTGRKHKPESIEKQKLSALTRKTTEKNESKRREGISKNNKGKKKSMEHTENIRKAKLGPNNPMFGKKWRVVNGKRIIYIP